MQNMQMPDENGHFNQYGGRYVAETLMPLLKEIEKAYNHYSHDAEFNHELEELYKHFVGRPTPLYHAKRLGEHIGLNKLYFKRDELNHTGAHKINNCLGQVLLAKRMGKKRIIAETGAGQHGVATAAICALFGLECVIYMGAKDAERQRPNIFRMEMLGAQLKQISSGSATLRSAMNEALRDWVASVDDSFYVIGTAAGPHPFPKMVRNFQSVIGREARQQILAYENRLPAMLIACIGGGSNALGLFSPFMADEAVAMVAVEASGTGGTELGEHAASINYGTPGILHGMMTYLLQNDDGQIADSYSISAGLDYPGIGPEHAYLNDIGRVQYEMANDEQAIEAFSICSKMEGIIPALEPSHALGWIINNSNSLPSDEPIIMNLCGRGDKDIFTVAKYMGVEL